MQLVDQSGCESAGGQLSGNGRNEAAVNITAYGSVVCCDIAVSGRMARIREVEHGLFTENVAAKNENCSTKNLKQDLTSLVDEKMRNKKKILCRRCQCVVFAPRRATLTKNVDSKELREMSVGGMDGKETERIDVWWFTSDEYAFETIGFLTVDNVDVLMCGDCEFGPIGWRTSDNKNFWVAAERMDYV